MMISRGVRSVAAIPTQEKPLSTPSVKVPEKDADKGQSSTWCGLEPMNEKIPNTMHSLWPECYEKLQWMRKHWKSDDCYATYGVDGSECSFYIYLSEIETFCPKLELRRKKLTTNASVTSLQLSGDMDQSAFSSQAIGPYASQFRDHLTDAFNIIRPTAHSLAAAGNLSLSRPRLRIVLYPSILTSLHEQMPQLLNEEAKQYTVRQWAELSVSLRVLGHEVTLCTSESLLKRILGRFPDASTPCQARRTLFLDLIFTDHPGLTVFRRLLGENRYLRFSCLVRLLDPFSTQPNFAFRPASTDCPLCGSQLNPKQFMSSLPPLLTPDNSFLGHIVDFSAHQDSSTPTAVLHLSSDAPAPAPGLISALRRHYRLLAASMDAHVTSALILDDEWRLGLSWKAYRQLLRSADVFVGVGWPLDTPLALEALAEGCVVLGTVRSSGKRLSDSKAGWPSNRLVRLQFGYVLRLVGPPTVMEVGEEVESSTLGLEKILQQLNGRKKASVVVKEFSAEAYVIRLDNHLRKQEFCEGNRDTWPPAKAISYYLGVKGDSCEETCKKRRLICEPAHFASINSRIELQERGLRCERITFDASPLLPYFLAEKETCAFQSEPKLFSCAEGQTGLMRICPCRDFLRDQSALCSQCL